MSVFGGGKLAPAPAAALAVLTVIEEARDASVSTWSGNGVGVKEKKTKLRKASCRGVENKSMSHTGLLCGASGGGGGSGVGSRRGYGAPRRTIGRAGRGHGGSLRNVDAAVVHSHDGQIIQSRGWPRRRRATTSTRAGGVVFRGFAGVVGVVVGQSHTRQMRAAEEGSKRVREGLGVKRGQEGEGVFRGRDRHATRPTRSRELTMTAALVRNELFSHSS